MTPIAADAWLAETLGRPVFRLAPHAATMPARELTDAMARVAGPADAFFYAKQPTTDIRGCTTLANAGFAVIDTSVTFAWAGSDAGPPRSSVEVTPARTDQHEAVLHVASTAFRWSRFHLDPAFPESLANHVKHRWVENYLLGKRGSAIYAATVGGATAGFLAVIETTVQDRAAAIIDLVGVAPAHQGRGVGVALVQRFIADWRHRAAELRVGTQAANVRSLRFYEQLGFRVAETGYVLHAHWRNGELIR